MSATKITQVHVYIIGGVLLLIIGAGLWFTLIKPLNEENTSLQGQIAGVESTQVQVDGKGFTISQASAAAAQLKLAQQRRDNNEAKLKALEVQKQLARGQQVRIASEDEMLRGTMVPWLQLPRVVVNLMESFAQKLAKRHNVTVFTNFAAPASIPNPGAIPKDIISYQLGGMTVQGDFNRVMDWVKAWNTAPLLVSVDGLKCGLADKNGAVTATCGLTAFVFPTGPGAVIPGAGGATAGAGGGAMMGGMGMGSGMGSYGTSDGSSDAGSDSGAVSDNPGGMNGP